MEKLPPDFPENVTALPPSEQPDQPRLVRPSAGRIWFFAIVFLIPLLMMIIFSIFLISSGVLGR